MSAGEAGHGAVLTTTAGPKVARLRPALAGALHTFLWLFGGLAAGLVLGNVVFEGFRAHTGDILAGITGAVFPVAGLVAGSALWGVFMGRLAGVTDRRAMARAGIVGFVPVTLGMGVLLQALEPVALRLLGQWVPIHRLFTLFFVPTAYIIVAVAAQRLAGAAGHGAARVVARRAGLAAAVAFLVVNLGMDALGWRVGAPGAAERFTMLVVMFAGNVGAALAGGGVLGMALGVPRGRHDMSHESDWARLAEYASQPEADVDLGRLEDAGIPTMVKGPETGIFGPGIAAPTPLGVTVFVPADRLEEARALLA